MSEVYSIYLEEENEEILSAIDKLWKERVFKVNNSYVFISSNEKTTTAAIMDRLRACSSAAKTSDVERGKVLKVISVVRLKTLKVISLVRLQELKKN